MWRMHYFVDACRLMQFATVLRMRCGDRMAAPQAARPRRFCAPTARAARRPGSSPAEGASSRGAAGDAGRRMDARLRVRAGGGGRRDAGDRPQQSLRLDAVPPRAGAPPGRAPGDPDLRAVAEKIAPLRLRSATTRRRGSTCSFPHRPRALLRGLHREVQPRPSARRARPRVRVVTVDPSGPVRRARGLQLARALRAGSSLELAASRTASRSAAPTRSSRPPGGPRTSPARRCAQVDAERFLYLIQEYAPLAIPPGSYAALAIESYRFPHAAPFASELLHDYFLRHRIAAGNAAVFEPGPRPSGPRRSGAAGGRAACGAARPERRRLAHVRARHPRPELRARPAPPHATGLSTASASCARGAGWTWAAATGCSSGSEAALRRETTSALRCMYAAQPSLSRSRWQRPGCWR